MLSWILYMTAMGTLALVFAISVSHKIRDYARFRASLGAYGLVPMLGPLAHSEGWLDLVLVSDGGTREEHETFADQPALSGLEYMLSEAKERGIPSIQAFMAASDQFHRADGS